MINDKLRTIIRIKPYLYFIYTLSLILYPFDVSARSLPPAIGYISAKEGAYLTINDRKTILFTHLNKKWTAQRRAEAVARRLNRLQSENQLNADRIQPVYDGKNYSLRIGKHVICTLETNDNGSQAKLSEIQRWANQLRQALGKKAIQAVVIRSGKNGHEGYASWYGGAFHGQQTASGERYDIHQLTAAHRTLPFGTQVLVTNVETDRGVIVKINDRGPFHSNRIIDLSPAAFKSIGYLGKGVVKVRVQILQ